MRIVRRKLLVHPTQIENGVDLADQVVGGHDFVEIKRIEELPLSVLPPTHHLPLPPMPVSNQRNHGSRVVSMGVLQQNPLQSRPRWLVGHGPLCADSVAKLGKRRLTRNNRIGAKDSLNRCCALIAVLESMLPARAPKIVLQQNLPDSGWRADSAPGRFRANNATLAIRSPRQRGRSAKAAR